MKPLKNIESQSTRKSNFLMHCAMFLISGAIILSSAYAMPDGLIGDKSKKKNKGKTEKVKKKKQKPNVAISKESRAKTDSKSYVQAMSKKDVKSVNGTSSFSSSKARYKLLIGNKKLKKQARKGNKGRQSEM